MATYFVASGGSNTAPYDTWAKAATSLQTALTAASAAGDIVVVQYNAVPSGDAELAADTTYTTANDVRVISASNDAGSAYTLTEMGTANWIGNSTTNRSIFINGTDDQIYLWGLTLRTAGSTADNIVLGNTANGVQVVAENCYLWAGNTASGAGVQFGNNSGANPHVFLKNCTIRFGATTNTMSGAGRAVLEGCTISSAGSAPSTLFTPTMQHSLIDFVGCDLSLVTGTLVGNASYMCDAKFERCKIGAAVVVLASQTGNPHRGNSASAVVLDCHSGDTHGIYGYYDALGALNLNTTVYYTTTGASWKIDTTANCSYFTPFVAPIFGVYHSGTSAITPYVEILRDGSATAYQTDEVWLQVGAKTTTGSTLATFAADRCTVDNKLAATLADQAAGAGTGSWTGENATAWSGKIDSGASLTPAEVGDISAQVCVGEPSITVYVDPVIRT